jgi:hypothetical protein
LVRLYEFSDALRGHSQPAVDYIASYSSEDRLPAVVMFFASKEACPMPSAEAIAGVMGTTLLLPWSGTTFTLSSTPIWVRPLAVALAVRKPQQHIGHQA